MSDGTESPLLGGHLSFFSNKSYSLPSDIKIAKLRSGFAKAKRYPGLFYLAQFELYDSNGGLFWTCEIGNN